jgi:hypothetical protein
MTKTAARQNGPCVVTVRVPIVFRRYGGAKRIVAPDGSDLQPSPSIPDGALLKALARAFRWRKLLENGIYATVAELAIAEKINPSYVSRILRLTLLAPHIVESILDGRQPSSLTLATLMRPFAIDWQDQARTLL